MSNRSILTIGFGSLTVLFAACSGGQSGSTGTPQVLQTVTPTLNPGASSSSSPSASPSGHIASPTGSPATSSPFTSSPSVSVSTLPSLTPSSTPSAMQTGLPGPSTSPTSSAIASSSPLATASPSVSSTPSLAPTTSPTPTSNPATQSTPYSTINEACDDIQGSNGSSNDILCGDSNNSADQVFYRIDLPFVQNTQPIDSVKFYHSNPGSFSVNGSVLAAAQSFLNESPAQSSFDSSYQSKITYPISFLSGNGYTPPVSGFDPNGNFTCSIYDGNNLIGYATAGVSSTTSNGTTTSTMNCIGQYPAYETSTSGTAYVTFPSVYNSSDVYTFIISQ